MVVAIYGLALGDNVLAPPIKTLEAVVKIMEITGLYSRDLYAIRNQYPGGALHPGVWLLFAIELPVVSRISLWACGTHTGRQLLRLTGFAKAILVQNKPAITNLWFLMGFCKMEFRNTHCVKPGWTMAWFSPQDLLERSKSSCFSDLVIDIPPHGFRLIHLRNNRFQRRLLVFDVVSAKTITLFLFWFMILEVYKEYIKLREADGDVKLSDNLMHQSLYIAWSCIECGVLAVGIPLYSNTLDPIQSY